MALYSLHSCSREASVGEVIEMYERIDTENYIYEFYNDDVCPTLVIIKKSKSVFEKDAVLKVLTHQEAIIGYFKALDMR